MGNNGPAHMVLPNGEVGACALFGRLSLCTKDSLLDWGPALCILLRIDGSAALDLTMFELLQGRVEF